MNISSSSSDISRQHRSPLVVGICGLIGSGKSVASDIFLQRGYRLIDVDKLGHLALEQRKEQIVARFGCDILSDGDSPDSPIDRRKLARKVFQNTKNLASLNSIVHPLMIEMIRKELKAIDVAPKYVISAALLFQMGLDKFCTKTIFIEVSFSKIMNRVEQRDSLSQPEIQSRLNQQANLLKDKQLADYLINNDGSMDDFRKRILAVIEQIEEEERYEFTTDPKG